MVAEIAGQQALTDLAAVLGAVLVIFAALAAATKLPPIKWLGRTVFVVPMTTWLHRELREAVEPIVSQLHPNGGSSTRDAIDRVEQRLDQLDRFEQRLDQLAAHVGPVLRDWRTSHPEMRADGEAS